MRCGEIPPVKANTAPVRAVFQFPERPVVRGNLFENGTPEDGDGKVKSYPGLKRMEGWDWWITPRHRFAVKSGASSNDYSRKQRGQDQDAKRDAKDNGDR